MNNLITLSEDETVALWRKILNFDISRRECSVERDDGINLDELLKVHIRQWYAHLLSTAPAGWVPTSDVSSLAQVNVDKDGVATVILPEHCVRVLEIQMSGWHRPICEFLSPTCRESKMQISEWLRGGTENPVAVAYSDRLILYSVDTATQASILRLYAVIRPYQDTYTFSHEAMSTIPQFATSLIP